MSKIRKSQQQQQQNFNTVEDQCSLFWNPKFKSDKYFKN